MVEYVTYKLNLLQGDTQSSKQVTDRFNRVCASIELPQEQLDKFDAGQSRLAIVSEAAIILLQTLGDEGQLGPTNIHEDMCKTYRSRSQLAPELVAKMTGVIESLLDDKASGGKRRSDECFRADSQTLLPICQS